MTLIQLVGAAMVILGAVVACRHACRPASLQGVERFVFSCNHLAKSDER